MKNKLMILAVAAIMLLAMGMFTSGASYRTRRPADGNSLKEKDREVVLSRIIIPALSVTNAPVTDVIAQLVKLSITYDPDHIGCSIMFNTAPTSEQQEGKTEEEREQIANETAQRRVTLNLGETPFLAAVDALCQTAGLVWHLYTVVVITTPENYEYKTRPSQ